MDNIAIKTLARSIMLCISITGLFTACGGNDDQTAIASHPLSLLADGEACNPSWSSATIYFGGHKVSYSGVNYTAAYWTQGNNPSTSNGPAGSGQPWIAGYTCSGSTSTSNASTTTTNAETSTTTGSTTTTEATTTTTLGNSCPPYVAGTAYADGKIVTNAGGYYRCMVGGWCSSGAPAYEPGAGWAWTTAWSTASAGACGGTTTSTSASTSSTTKATTTTTGVSTTTTTTASTTTSTRPDGTVLIAPNDVRIAYDGVWNPKISASSAILQRHSPSCMSNPNCAPAWAVAVGIPQQHPGVVIRFKTSSPSVTILMRESDATPIEQRRWPFQQYGIYRDGTWMGTIDGVRSTGKAHIVGDGNMHTWEVVLPHQLALEFLGLELPQGATLAPIAPLNKPVYVAIGDSITHGEGQVGAYEGFAWKLARAKGWELINLGIGGTTITPEMATLNLKSHRVDVVTIEWGYNDWASEYFSLPTQVALYSQLLREIRAAQPDARIYCITPLATRTVTGLPTGEASLEEYRQMMRDSVASRVAQGDINVFVVEGPEISTVSDLVSDGVHLSTSGAAHVAQELIKRIH